MIPMYHRDYTDFPEDFAHEMTYKRYCKAMDEREKAEDARYTLEIWSIHTLTLMI